MRETIRVSILFWLLCVAASPALAARQHVPPADEQIKDQIAQKLFDAGLVGVTVDVQSGHVTLGGTVPSLQAIDEAVKQARKIKDIKGVSSQLTVKRGASDVDLAAWIGDAVVTSPFFTMFDDVTVHVLDGVATLSGEVTSSFKSRGLVEAASRVEGVQRVIDALQVLPTSMSDDEIRNTLATRIYTESTLWRYSSRPDPPIHIIVRDGRVTLVGLVDSETDRRQVEALAHEVFGVRAVQNDLQVRST